MYYETIINKHYQDINPVQFGYESCEKSHHYGPALRDHWIFHFVVSGKGYFRIQEREYTVSEGEIFVIPPYIETYYEADAQNPWEYIWIGFTMSDKMDVSFDDVIYMPGVALLFEEMKQCSDMTVGKTAFLCSKIWQLLAQMMERHQQKENPIEKALNIIHSEYMTGISVQQIAERLCFERTYFSSLFKKKIGISPKQYLLRYRMEQAARLISDYGYSVSITALSVGYSDVYIFSKMFKQHFGVSPLQYKKENQLVGG